MTQQTIIDIERAKHVFQVCNFQLAEREESIFHNGYMVDDKGVREYEIAYDPQCPLCPKRACQ